MILHDYWRSSAAYRVRIACNVKRVEYSVVAHDLRTGAQRAPEYLVTAPQGLVPALETADGVLTQTMAIVEWLEESYPDPPLLPSSPFERAIVRSMAHLVTSDIHPVNNLRILTALKRDFGADQAAIDGWVRRWMADGFAALETMVAAHGRGFAFGDTPGLADIALVPQWYNAERFALDTAPYPRLAAAVAAARALPAFAVAAPEQQPGAD